MIQQKLKSSIGGWRFHIDIWLTALDRPGLVEPSGFLIQVPEVAGPQEEVEEPEDAGDISLAEGTLEYCAATVNYHVNYDALRTCAGPANLVGDPVVGVGGVLEPIQTVGPGGTTRQPENSNDYCNTEVDHWRFLLFVGVELGEENVDGEAGEAVEPSDHASEHEELRVGGKVAREGDWRGHGAICAEVLDGAGREVVQPKRIREILIYSHKLRIAL